MPELPTEATPGQQQLFDRLAPLGWEPYHTGGGCWGLVRTLRGAVQGLLTNGDLDFPEEDQWTACIMTPEWEGAGLASWWRNVEGSDSEGDVNTLDKAVAQMDAFAQSTLPDGLFALIEDRPSAEAWIKALGAAELMFHFEDDPSDISWGNGWEPTPAEVALLKHQVARLYEQEWGDLECPIGYALLVLDGKA